MEVRIVGATDIALLDKSRVKEAIKSAFRGLPSGASVQPSQTVTVLPGDAGDAIFYPGALSDLGVFGVKVSPYLTSRSRAGQSPVTAYTLLLSTETGEPVLLADSLALTTARTAATTALALEYLTPAEAESLAAVGSGPQAIEHLRYALAQRDWDRVSIFSPSLSNGVNAERAREISDEFPDVEIVTDIEAAVRNADVVMLCTSSGTPVVDSRLLAATRVVTSISTNVANAHEVAPAWLHEADVYCDYRQTAPTTAGDFKLASAEHGWDPQSIVGDLPDLITGAATVRESDRPRYFRSTGLGIEDLAVATQL